MRFKSPEKVVSEISEVKSKNIVFTDDNFLSNVRHAERIVNLIREKGIKRRYNIQTRSDVIVSHPRLIEAWADVGLENVFLGFEKGTQEELDSLTKDNTVENNEKALQILRSVGIEPVASFIVDAEYSRQDFAALAEYIRKLKLKKPSFSILTPLPGTRLFEQLVGKLICRNYDLFDLMHPVLPTRLPLEEFCQEFAKLYRTAYPSVWRFISRVYVFFKSLMKHVPYSDWREVLIDWKRLTVPETYLEDMQRACLNHPSRQLKA